MLLSTAGRYCALSLLAAALPHACAGAEEVVAKPPSRAVWIWGKTVREEGAEKVAARLAAARIDTALMLVKGVGGATNFSSNAKPVAEADDILRAMLDACRPKGIAVHAWFVFHGDERWVAARPDEAAQGCCGPDGQVASVKPSTERICPAAPEYRAYLKGLIRDLLTDYPVAGIHLDCIRYPTLASCFCPRHRAKAEALGLDFEKIRQAAIKSTRDPKARGHLIKLYQQGDADIKGWVDLRREEIDSFVRETAQLLAELRPGGLLSAALMPEGAEPDDAFALCHYAQDYRTFGQACAFLCPMSYHASYEKPATWPVDIALLAAQRSNRPILAGLQAFTPSTPTDLAAALSELERRQMTGFVLFSYAAMTEERWAQLKP